MPRKNPAAVALAKRRLPGKKNAARRKEIAAKAAAAKWQKIGDDPEARKKAVEAANSARRKANTDNE